MTSPARSAPAPVPPAAVTFDEVRARIARIPRVSIAIRPTPMVEAPNLTRALGGPRIFVKRDDLTGVALGRQQAPQSRVPAGADDGRAPGRGPGRPRPPIELGAPDRGGLQPARSPDGARAGGRPAARDPGKPPRRLPPGGRDPLRGGSGRAAADARPPGGGVPAARRAAPHPERQPDVRRRLGDRLPGDDDGDDRAAPRRGCGADRPLHVVLGQGPGRPRARPGALGRLPGARRDRDPRVRRARPHRRHRQRGRRHARPRRAGPPGGRRELRRLRRPRLRPSQPGRRGGGPAVRPHRRRSSSIPCTRGSARPP